MRQLVLRCEVMTSELVCVSDSYLNVGHVAMIS
jgi:hypothetical protein